MTDRLSSFVVILDKNMRDDDLEETIIALKHIKGVLDVKPVVADLTLTIAESRAVRKIKSQLWNALKDDR